MLPKTFIAKNGKEITLRAIEKSDLKRVKEFMEYINAILDEDDFLTINEKYSQKTERKWIKESLEAKEKGTGITIFAECGGRIIGTVNIQSRKWRESHIASLGITVKKDCRGLGIGTQLISAAIDEAKSTLISKPRVIELEVCETNERAQRMYERLGFKKIAELPNRVQRRGQLISKSIMEKQV